MSWGFFSIATFNVRAIRVYEEAGFKAAPLPANHEWGGIRLP